jgi:cysteinyl-tRNA synthetase
MIIFINSFNQFFNMTLKIFNSFGNKLEEFVPINQKHVGIYTCGPTVYNYAHIGNYRAYVWEDLLVRYLRFLGYTVTQVMNLTDIDDKTIKGSIEAKITLEEFTGKYKAAFFEDLKTLNITPANFYPAATEHIGEMVTIIQKLLDKKIAYTGEDGSIYYSIKKFKDYGKLAGLDTSKLKDGARIKQDEYEKEGIGDFALWKNWDETDGPVFWETTLGKGRPGWHIECSAMSSKYLGESFDLHTGGVDNKFPHHENEIAQSEGASGKKFVKYWMHCEHLMVEGKKMSKSLGNFYTLRDLIAKGLNPMAIRYTLINAQYRQPLNFTINSVKDSEKAIEGIQNLIERLQKITEEKDNDSVSTISEKTLNDFSKSMDDNLNVPNAMATVFDFSREINKLIDENGIGKTGANETLNFLKNINEVLGILTFEQKELMLTEEQKELIKARETARNSKDWAKADELRDKLKDMGLELKDNPDGTTTIKQIN